MAGLLSLVRRGLGRTHLVQVAAALARELHLGTDDLRALRLPVDLLQLFPRWHSGSTEGFHVPPARLTLLPEHAARPMRALRLHVSPSTGSTAIVLTLLRDLRRTLDRSVRLVTIVDPETDARELRRLAGVIIGRGSRVRFLTMDFATIFARDNAMAATDRDGHRVLLIPRAFRTLTNDGLEPLDVRATERRLGVRVVRSRLYWHGGNILFDGETLAIGADTIAENATRLGLTRGEVSDIFVAELGQQVTVLGNPARGHFDTDRNRVVASGQASYHIDLDVALLGRTRRHGRTALLADPHLGLAQLPAVLDRRWPGSPPYLSSPSAQALIAREYRLTARQRDPALRAYGRVLIARGYRVVRVPQLQTRGTEEGPGGLPGQDFVYCNVLPGLNRGRPAVHYVPWGIPRLDAAARQSFLDAGVHPVRISRTAYLASAMMERAAGLRCFCGTLP